MQGRTVAVSTSPSLWFASAPSQTSFKGQTKLDGGIRESQALPALAAGSGKPGHALVQPN